MVPLLLLPGLMCDRAVWTETMAALPGGIDIDVAAYGELDSLGAMAERVLSLAPERFAIAGHSMGGRVALEVFRRAPARMAGLALLDTNTPPRAAGEAGAKEERERMELLAVARNWGTRAMAMQWVRGMVHPSRRGESALIDPIIDMFGRKTADTFAAQVRALLDRPDATPLLGQINCPALVLCGREDEWAPLARHQAMAAAVASATLAVIENCGHMAPMERPRKMAEALAAWLARVTEASRSAAAA